MADRRKLAQFEKRAAEALGVRARDVPGLFRGARSTSIRINRLAGEAVAEDTLSYLSAELPDLTPVPWCEDAYLWPGGEAYEMALPLAHEGRIYLQNASSLLPVVALDPQPGERVLDVAAAPGGKAFHVAARMGNAGELWLNDAIKPRAEKLRGLAEVYGAKYHELTMHPAQYLDKYLPGESFDRILLDVQCSGEGRFDLRRPDALRNWSEERVEKYKYLQTKMVDVAYRLLRPGGVMVYSTCTISPEENEYPVSQVLGRHSDLAMLPIDVTDTGFRPGLTSWRGHKFDQTLARAVRVAPSEVFEGFFAARLQRQP